MRAYHFIDNFLCGISVHVKLEFDTKLVLSAKDDLETQMVLVVLSTEQDNLWLNCQEGMIHDLLGG